ncbi:MAG: multiprotein bridging factor aMBF1 [Methanoculleaceae archaeon]
MCGKEIRGPYRLIRIEGAELRVCQKCARYGTEISAPEKGAVNKRAARTTPSTGRRKRDIFDYIEGEIAEDCGERVREARMATGMTTRQLADRIKEKEQLIRKIERGELIPEDDVRIKLEKALGISLLEEGGGEGQSGHGGQVTTTFGDLIRIRHHR